jgi:MYXO-CTERM domain-containing protein
MCVSTEDGTHFCSDDCDDTRPCPEGFSCDEVCVPEGGLLGEECAGNDDCLSELCAHFAPELGDGVNWQEVCSRYCSDFAPCPSDFTCRDIGGQTLCVPPVPERVPEHHQYGCGCDATAGGGSLALFALAPLFARRRQRRTPTPR